MSPEMFAMHAREDGESPPADKWPKGFAVIYVQEQQETPPEELELIIQRAEQYAASQNLIVTESFIEPLPTRTNAIAHKAMITRLRGRRNRFLIVPGVHHFADLGKKPRAVVEDIEALDVEVIFAGHVE